MRGHTRSLCVVLCAQAREREERTHRRQQRRAEIDAKRSKLLDERSAHRLARKQAQLARQQEQQHQAVNVTAAPSDPVKDDNTKAENAPSDKAQEKTTVKEEEIAGNSVVQCQEDRQPLFNLGVKFNF